MQRLSILISLIPILYKQHQINTVSKIIEQLWTWQKINDYACVRVYSKHNAYRCAGLL